MGLIPDDTIAEIRARVDIVAVIGQHVQLRKAGRNFKGLCPFHGEKTPSFNVTPDKGFFYCFGCQKKGDAFTFVMEVQGKSFHEAAEQLAAMLGITLPEVEENPALRAARGERAQMLSVNKLATAFFREVLADPKRGAAGRTYLERRQIDPEQQARFQLGYAPGDWHALADYLAEKRADLEIAVKLGLIARQPRAGGFYDRFRDRLVCPVVVPGGEVVGFSARLVGEAPKDEHGDAIGAKYINSPESTVYKKSRLLFGLQQARDGFRAKGRAVLVEGNFDVISMHQAGFVETIAPLGTALTAEQVESMRRLASKVILFYDGDRAGYRATVSSLELCLAAELPAYIARRPGNAGSGGAGVLADGADPDTVVHAGGPDRLAEMLDRAMPALEFLAYEVWTLAKSPEAKARAIDDAAKLLRKVASTTERDLIAGTLATAMQLDPGVVQRALARASRPDAASHPASHGHGPGHRGTEPERAPSAPATPPPNEELDLLCLLSDHPGLAATAEESGVLSLLTDARLRDMYSASRAGHSLLELAPLHLPMPSAQAVIAARYAKDSDPARHLDQMVAGLRARQQKVRASELQKQLAEARRSGDVELARRLADEIVNRK